MRIKKILKNLMSEIIPQIILAFLGIFKSKIFLEYLGTDVVGLYQLFSQVLGYLSIVEGGMGSAVIYRLYKPIVEKNLKKLSEIRNGTRTIFSIIILIILVLGIFAGFIIPYLIKDNTFNFSFIIINFLIYIISEILLYTTVFERSMFTATESTYKLNRIVKSTLIIKGILEIILAVATRNITCILIMYIIINIISNVVVKIMGKKEFSYIKNNDKKDFSVLKDVKNLLVHKIAGLVASNIDIIILSTVNGLGEVVIYSTYMLYTNTLKSLMEKISISFLGSIGNIIAENKKDSYRVFKEYNSFIYFIAIIVGIQFFFSIDGFINIWYKGEVLTQINISILFALVLIYNIIRLPLTTFTESAGLFKETKICPILEAIINLVLSLILIKPLGMAGLLLGTFLSLIISEFFIKPHIIFKNVFEKNGVEYYKISYKFILIIIIELIIVYFIKMNMNFSGLFNWLLYSLIFAIVNIICITVLFIIMKEDFFIKRIKQIFIKQEENNK